MNTRFFVFFRFIVDLTILIPMKKYAFSIAVASFLIGCSTKKDTFQNRNYHKMTSWFNGVFNAEEELAKKQKELKLNFTEDYGEILPIGVNYYGKKQIAEENGPNSFGNLPTSGSMGNNTNNNSVPRPTGYDAVEGKAMKVIEKHSMLIKGSERNQMIAKAYLLIGKSKFQQGKYFEALDALNYVTKNFKNSKYFDEAVLFTTLSDIKGGNYFDGQEKLIKLYDKKDLSKELKYIVAANYADFLIENQKYEEAIEPLEKAEYYCKDSNERARVLYALGQVYSKLGKQEEAGQAFTEVYKLKPGFDMEVKSQLAIAENFNPKINNYSNYKQHLLGVSKKGIYTSKTNEFYYGVAEMAFKDGNLDEAIKYSKLSLKEPISDPYIRGKAYENFANIEFSRGNYLYATSYFDSATTTYAKESDKDRIKKKNDVLKKLMEMHYLVQKNDSILRIAKLTKDEQTDFFTKYIEKLKADEEKKLIQELKQVAEFQLGTKTGSFTSSFDQAAGGKFYFYNQSLKSNGTAEFQRIWGSPTLKDNWRNSENPGATIEDKESELKGTIVAGDPRRFEIGYYLEKIPKSIKDLNDLKITRDTTQLALGAGYYDHFNDTKLSAETLEKLLASPPKTKEVEVQALYQLYRIHKDRDKTLEDKYKNIILKDFGNTLYAGYILNPDVDFITAETKEALLDYEKTYNLYKEEKYDEVKARVSTAITKYPTEIIIAKFALLNAFAVSKTDSRENFEKALEIVVLAYDGTDEAKRAKQLLEKLRNPNAQPKATEPQTNTQPTNEPVNNSIEGEDPVPQSGGSTNPLGGVDQQFTPRPRDPKAEKK